MNHESEAVPAALASRHRVRVFPADLRIFHRLSALGRFSEKS